MLFDAQASSEERGRDAFAHVSKKGQLKSRTGTVVCLLKIFGDAEEVKIGVRG